MSSYPPPLNWQPIYNPNNFPSLDDNLTQREADLRYLIKTGSDTAVGSITVKNPLQATFFKATQGTYPDAAFTNSTNLQTGLYFGTSTTCGIICNGAGKMTFGSSATTSFQPIVIPDASASTPSLSFSSVTNAGLYYGGANQVAVASAGGQVAGFETGGMKLYNTSISGYTPSLLGFYHEATQNCTMNNGNNNQTLSILFTRVGRLCNIRIPYFNTTNTNGLSSTPAISFNIAPINNLYTYAPPNGAYFSCGVGYAPGRSRIYLQLLGTNLYFFADTLVTLPNNTYFEHLGSTITYIFT